MSPSAMRGQFGSNSQLAMTLTKMTILDMCAAQSGDECFEIGAQRERIAASVDSQSKKVKEEPAQICDLLIMRHL